MDIADHQSSWVEPSGWWTKFTSLPYTTMVPLAMALSRIFWSAASAFAISAHCARGIFQNETYEYIGGFSLPSDICALAGETVIASAHSPAKTPHTFMFMFFILRNLAQDLQFLVRQGQGSVHQSSRGNSSRLLPVLRGIGPSKSGGELSTLMFLSTLASVLHPHTSPNSRRDASPTFPPVSRP